VTYLLPDPCSHASTAVVDGTCNDTVETGDYRKLCLPRSDRFYSTSASEKPRPGKVFMLN
jgi:hypothetical protein